MAAADLDTLDYYQTTFDLRLVTPHGYWYVDQGQEVRQEDLEEAAREFEDHIYPGVTAIFGAEWSPGVDNDTSPEHIEQPAARGRRLFQLLGRVSPPNLPL